MANFKVAKRYAKGLMDFAQEEKKTEQVQKEMDRLNTLIIENRDLQNFLKNPLLDSKKKTKIAQEVFKGFSKETRTFILMVIGHKRESNLREIAQEYHGLYNHSQGIHKAKLVSAKALSQSEIDAIIAKAQEKFKDNWKMEVETQVDESIIGGFIVKMGAKQLDASLKNKLNQLKKEFSYNDYVAKI